MDKAERVDQLSIFRGGELPDAKLQLACFRPSGRSASGQSGATFMLTWVFNGSRGSVLLPMVTHVTVNSVGAGLMFPLFSGSALLLLWWIYGFIWLCADLGVLLFSANREGQLVL